MGPALREAIWAKVAFPCAEKVQVFGSAPARDENRLRHDVISPVVLLMSDLGFAVAEERVQELGT